MLGDKKLMCLTQEYLELRYKTESDAIFFAIYNRKNQAKNQIIKKYIWIITAWKAKWWQIIFLQLPHLVCNMCYQIYKEKLQSQTKIT